MLYLKCIAPGLARLRVQSLASGIVRKSGFPSIPFKGSLRVTIRVV